jgi:acyl carrier protein
MNSRPEVISLLRQIVLEVTEKPLPEISSTVPIAELGIDSISLAEIMMRIEDSLGIEVPATEWLRVRTIEEILNLIERTRPT